MTTRDAVLRAAAVAVLLGGCASKAHECGATNHHFEAVYELAPLKADPVLTGCPYNPETCAEALLILRRGKYLGSVCRYCGITTRLREGK